MERLEIELQEVLMQLEHLATPTMMSGGVYDKWHIALTDKEEAFYRNIVKSMADCLSAWQVALRDKSFREESTTIIAMCRLEGYHQWYADYHADDAEQDFSSYVHNAINDMEVMCQRWLLPWYNYTPNQGRNNKILIDVVLSPNSRFMRFCMQEEVEGYKFTTSKKLMLLYDILDGVPDGWKAIDVMKAVKSAGFKLPKSNKQFYDNFSRNNSSKVREKIKQAYDNFN